MAEGADEEVVLLGDLGDEGDHLGEFITRDGDILKDGGRSDAGEGGEGGATGGGELQGFCVITGQADVAGATGAGQGKHLVGFFGDRGRMPVGLHEQERLAVTGQADLGVVLDAADGHAVEELQRAGDDLRGDDVGHRLRGVFHAIVARQHRAAGGGAGEDLEQDLGDDAERAFGADEEVLHRISGDVLDAGVAEAGDATVR